MRKILISAYACEPGKGSEQSVGWNMVLQLARRNEVHVITRANDREVIEDYLHKHPTPNIHFHYYDTPSLFLKFKNKEKGVYLYYCLWQIGILSLVRRLIREHQVDYLYHLTFGSAWLPCFLFLFKPAFIWGPLGGGEAVPDSFIKTLSWRGRLLQRFRKFLRRTVCINPLFLLNARKASLLLCRTPSTVALFPKRYQHKCHLLSDGGIEEDIFRYQCRYEPSQKVRLIATSRLIHFKNVQLIVKALCHLKGRNDMELTIVGYGPEEAQLRQLVFEHQLEGMVKMVSFVPRAEVLEYLEQSDIYLFASLREACNLSLLEAMAVGLPVICLNWSGVALSTDDNCAIRLPVTSPEQMPGDMAAAIEKLVADAELRRRMGEAGRQRIREVFNWDAKGSFMEELLTELERINK